MVTWDKFRRCGQMVMNCYLSPKENVTWSHIPSSWPNATVSLATSSDSILKQNDSLTETCNYLRRANLMLSSLCVATNTFTLPSFILFINILSTLW